MFDYRSSFIAGFVIYYVLYFIIKYLFVIKEGGFLDNRYIHYKKIKIFTNAVFYRRLFHVFTFFLLFYFMLVGVFRAIARIIISAGLNLFYLPRLDTALTVKGWEWLDKGILYYMLVLYTCRHMIF